MRTLAAGASLFLVTFAVFPHAQQPAVPPAGLNPAVTRLVAAVSEEHLGANLRRLESFVTRNTMSDPTGSGRGIGAARQWIFDAFKGYGANLQVSFDTYQVAKKGRIARDVEIRNVVAVLPGRTARRFYVAAHYDSVARHRPTPAPTASAQPVAATASPAANAAAPAGAAPPAVPPRSRASTPGAPAAAPAGEGSGAAQPDVFEQNEAEANLPAPGVNDDGSGTALVMELARVFAQSGVTFDATLVFIAFAGEEQRLVGSTLHSASARASHLAIEGVLSNDIVGGARGGTGLVNRDVVCVFSEPPEDSPSRALARYIRAQAARYVPSHRVELVARYDRFARGGDHSPFNLDGFPAVRVTEAHEDYSRQHTLLDTFEGISVPYLAANARVNAAALAGLALAPPAPAVTDDRGRPLLTRLPSGYDAHLRWISSGSRASRYRVYRRKTWSQEWDADPITVSAATEHVLPNVSIDDYVFGVAAVDEEGNESLIAAYVNPPRTREDFKAAPIPPTAGASSRDPGTPRSRAARDRWVR